MNWIVLGLFGEQLSEHWCFHHLTLQLIYQLGRFYCYCIWKRPNVSPLPKKRNLRQAANWRTVSLVGKPAKSIFTIHGRSSMQPCTPLKATSEIASPTVWPLPLVALAWLGSGRAHCSVGWFSATAGRVNYIAFRAYYCKRSSFNVIHVLQRFIPVN